jgi:hypothetical protein
VLVERVRDATAGAISNRSDLDDVLASLELWEESVTSPGAGLRLNADATT